ncbi:MAG: hemolysin family protein [Dehalococcoidia bacterium]|nr:hemolysin family protein [Dehalococcoidia bacterium]
MSLILLFLAFSEASVTAISRRRTPASTNNLSTILGKYINNRQLILSAISAASTSMLVIVTMLFSIQIDLITNNVTKSILAIIIIIIAASLIRQTARSLALMNPEFVGFRLSKLIDFILLIYTPFVWIMTRPVSLMTKLLGRNIELVEPSPIDELLNILDYQANNNLYIRERGMIKGVLQMNNQTARELMSPRTDLTAISVNTSLDEATETIAKSGYSRIPVYETNIDIIIGILYAKDLLLLSSLEEIRSILRPPFFVPESRKADALLTDFRVNQVHLGIVVDEYGGTAGVVTVEDLVEEIVGEISDEYDEEQNEVEQLSTNELIVDASIPIDELKDILGINEFIKFQEDHDDFDSIGGLILTELGRIAIPGDQIKIETNNENNDLHIKVLSIRGHRIKKVRITKEPRNITDK